MTRPFITQRPLLTLGVFMLLLCLFLSPAVASAGASASFGVVGTFVGRVLQFISEVLIPLIFAISLLVFIWGVFLYFILGGADEAKRKQGKGLIIWAIIGFVLMITIWGIVNLFANGIASGLGGRSPTDHLKYQPGVNAPG